MEVVVQEPVWRVDGGLKAERAEQRLLVLKQRVLSSPVGARVAEHLAACSEVDGVDHVACAAWLLARLASGE